MGKVYDDWGRLVEAVLRREKLRQLCYAQSMSSSDSSCRLDGDFSHLHAEMAMVRLQEELIYTLTQNKHCFEHGYMSLPTFERDPMDTSPELSSSSSLESEDCVLDLVNPDMIPQLKAIASKMFALNCDGEFCEVFVRFGRGAFAVYLEILGVEEVSFDDVQGMDWNSLNSEIRKWRFAINKFILLYLAKAKLLFDQVLGEHGQVIRSTCLVEASKPSLMWFLNLGCRVAIGPHKPEWLFCLLDMNEELVPLIPSVEALFPDETGSCIRVEFHNLLTRLQDSAKVILMKLGNALRPFSSDPSPSGGVHSLTKYVLSYMLRFAKYDCIIADEKDAIAEQSISGAMAAHLHSVTSALEASIAKMSDLYQDTSLKHIFVMNNIHYMVTKINNSKIKAHFGDEWIKKHIMNFRSHALNYQRSTWSSVLPLPRDRGSDVDRANLKAKYRDFMVVFENVYKNQTGWHVPNVELREELRNAASTTVVAAYRSFFYSIRDDYFRDKHIKYSADEMETLMQDLLEDSSKSLSHNELV